VQLYVISRHGESTLNFENRINGDPAVEVLLTEKGRAEATLLGQQIAHVPLEVCMHSRFGRTHETAVIALTGRKVPLEVEPLLDDIDVGELEGKTLEDYRAWKHEHTRQDAFPGGESLDDAARRWRGRSRRSSSSRTRFPCATRSTQRTDPATSTGRRISSPTRPRTSSTGTR
jgi:broad specificity phosphatase PhoE